MDNLIILSNSKNNKIEYDIEIQGVDASDMTTCFVIETGTMDLSFEANEVDGKWELNIPPLTMVEATAYSYKITVISDGYYFEPIRGTVNITKSHDLYVSTPQNTTLKPKKPTEVDEDVINVDNVKDPDGVEAPSKNALVNKATISEPKDNDVESKAGSKRHKEPKYDIGEKPPIKKTVDGDPEKVPSNADVAAIAARIMAQPSKKDRADLMNVAKKDTNKTEQETPPTEDSENDQKTRDDKVKSVLLAVKEGNKEKRKVSTATIKKGKVVYH